MKLTLLATIFNILLLITIDVFAHPSDGTGNHHTHLTKLQPNDDFNLETAAMVRRSDGSVPWNVNQSVLQLSRTGGGDDIFIYGVSGGDRELIRSHPPQTYLQQHFNADNVIWQQRMTDLDTEIERSFTNFYRSSPPRVAQQRFQSYISIRNRIDNRGPNEQRSVANLESDLRNTFKKQSGSFDNVGFELHQRRQETFNTTVRARRRIGVPIHANHSEDEVLNYLVEKGYAHNTEHGIRLRQGYYVKGYYSERIECAHCGHPASHWTDFISYESQRSRNVGGITPRLHYSISNGAGATEALLNRYDWVRLRQQNLYPNNAIWALEPRPLPVGGVTIYQATDTGFYNTGVFAAEQELLTNNNRGSAQTSLVNNFICGI